jgi:hypothetical protein
VSAGASVEVSPAGRGLRLDAPVHPAVLEGTLHLIAYEKDLRDTPR